MFGSKRDSFPGRASVGLRPAFVFGALAAGLAAQGTFVWTQPPTAVRPPLGNASLVYDAARGENVLFSIAGNTTWAWNGTNWSQRAPAHSPVADVLQLTYDPARTRVMSCGGLHGRLETWDWDGVDWTDRTPALLPPARYDYPIAFDSLRHRLVLFGGGVGGVGASFDDTWEFDGLQWHQLAPAASPPMRARHEMAFDATRGRTVMFGGTSPSWFVFGDTWEWNGTDWSQRFPAHAPRSRFEQSMTFDSLRHRVVLFGGGGNGVDNNDTWEWDGSDWTLRNATNLPRERAFLSLTYDVARDRLVMFGGGGYIGFQNDTWEMAPVGHPASYTRFGQGCAGHFGVPSLDLFRGRPVLGTTMTLACTNLPPDHFTTLWLGFSNTNWLGGALPFDLGAFGMTYCTLYVSNDYVTTLLNWGGTAYFQLTIPNQPQLVGLPFYTQVGTIDRVNPLGLIVSNAGISVLGDG